MKIRLAIPRTYLYFTFKEIIYLLSSTVFTRLNYKSLLNKYKKEFSRVIGSEKILPTSSATNGLHILLSALKLPVGSEVLMGPITVEGFIRVIKSHGLVVKFINIDNKNYIIKKECLIKSITNKTRIIIITPLFGWYGKIEEIKELIKEKNILLIEDCAQAFGCKYKNKFSGTWGDFGLYSFGPVKYPTGVSGGAILFSDKKREVKLIEEIDKCDRPNKISIIKEVIKYSIIWLMLKRVIFNLITFKIINIINYNQFIRHFKSSKSEIKTKYYKNTNKLKKYYPQIYLQPNSAQMKMVISQLNVFKKTVKIRIKNVEILYNKLSPSVRENLQSKPEEYETHSYWQMALRQKKKKEFIIYMRQHKIDISGLVWLRSYTKEVYGERKKEFYEADCISDEIVYLPIFPNLKRHELEYIGNIVNKFNLEIK
ncbi:MAG: aminotransferase class V-fold PLP-dependent enzyme [Candidatus Aureabacteria bacterium]|nr:aminotransferase class V-fold PLP-dependent enzyme [Candidatus Auribacterota bacterium]